MKGSKVLKNASWIIVCRVAQSVLSMVVTILTARFLGPSNYGIINYAAAIGAFFVPFMQVGLNFILVQAVIQNDDREGEVMGTALAMSLASGVLSVIGVFAFVMVANYNDPTTIIVCVLYSLLLIFQALEHFQYWFQAKLLSKYTSITMLVAYFVVSAYKIYLLLTGKSVYWFAVSQALDYAIIAFALFAIFNKVSGVKLSFSKEMAKKMFDKGKHYIFPTLMVTLYANIGKVMLTLMTDEAICGFYSAAVMCVGMATFVYNAIIESVRPVILEAKKKGDESYKKMLTALYSFIIYLALLESIFLTIFPKLIVNILYGADYAATIPLLRVLAWYLIFSYIGLVRNVWILAEEKEKHLWKINLGGAIVNLVLNFILIPILGAMGSAITALITQIFTNVIMGYLIKPIRENNTLMIKSLNPKCLLDMVNIMKQR